MHFSQEHGGKTQRIVLLDSIRAVAIVSMVIGHVANYSFLWRTSHFSYYVWDGAQLFMLVSGIVVGLVQHKVVHRKGMRASAGKLARRAGLLYVIQFVLIGIGLLTAYLLPGTWTADFWPDGLDTWQQALSWSLLLSANPIYINFLSTYVVLLLAAIPIIYLLKTRHVGVVLAVTAAIYVIGLRFPTEFTLRNGPNGLAGMNNATWFVLFVTGLVVGWNWHRWNVSERLRSKGASITAGVSWALLLGLVIIDATMPTALGRVDWAFDKDQMGPGRLIASWVFFVMLFWVASDLARTSWGWRVLDPMAVLGGRALDAVVILTIASILLPGLAMQASSSRFAQVMALVVLGICWAWAYGRHAYRHRRDGLARTNGSLAFTPR